MSDEERPLSCPRCGSQKQLTLISSELSDDWLCKDCFDKSCYVEPDPNTLRVQTYDLRAAAERVAGSQFYQTGTGNFSSKYWNGSPYDAVQVAKAWLEEHRADDGEPVTEEWFESLGAVKKVRYVYDIASQCFVLGCLRFTVRKNNSVVIVGESEEILLLLTRGQVRLICRALGITTTETPAGRPASPDNADESRTSMDNLYETECQLWV